jgi:hypothetical protein
MGTIAKILVVVLLAAPVVIVGVMFVWGAIRDGQARRAAASRHQA